MKHLPTLFLASALFAPCISASAQWSRDVEHTLVIRKSPSQRYANGVLTEPTKSSLSASASGQAFGYPNPDAATCYYIIDTTFKYAGGGNSTLTPVFSGFATLTSDASNGYANALYYLGGGDNSDFPVAGTNIYSHRNWNVGAGSHTDAFTSTPSQFKNVNSVEVAFLIQVSIVGKASSSSNADFILDP